MHFSALFACTVPRLGAISAHNKGENDELKRNKNPDWWPKTENTRI